MKSATSRSWRKKQIPSPMRKLDFTSAELWAKIDAVDERRENAYKAVLIISLCATLSAWVAIGSVFPLLYTFINLSNNQIGHVLEFCEDTATSVVHDSRELFELYADHAAEHRALQLAANASSNAVHDIFKRQTGKKDKDCPCTAPPGPPGEPGRSGLKGTPGTPGPKGNPAVLPCQPPPDYKKWCTTPCPQGPQGPAGSRGPLGDKGPKGDNGKNGVNGVDGKRGPQGFRGKHGTPGFDGEDGEPGRDRVPEPFTPGPPGPMGEPGTQGPIGPPGMPGIEGPQGPMGTRGDSGRNGVPGQRGSPGLEGAVGAPGEDGEKGVCPTLCASDGGVFFIDPPEWFFKDEDNHRRRR